MWNKFIVLRILTFLNIHIQIKKNKTLKIAHLNLYLQVRRTKFLRLINKNIFILVRVMNQIAECHLETEKIKYYN
jgi:hypothetical protein